MSDDSIVWRSQNYQNHELKRHEYVSHLILPIYVPISSNLRRSQGMFNDPSGQIPKGFGCKRVKILFDFFHFKNLKVRSICSNVSTVSSPLTPPNIEHPKIQNEDGWLVMVESSLGESLFWLGGLSQLRFKVGFFGGVIIGLSFFLF